MIQTILPHSRVLFGVSEYSTQDACRRAIAEIAEWNTSSELRPRVMAEIDQILEHVFSFQPGIPTVSDYLDDIDIYVSDGDAVQHLAMSRPDVQWAAALSVIISFTNNLADGCFYRSQRVVDDICAALIKLYSRRPTAERRDLLQLFAFWEVTKPDDRPSLFVDWIIAGSHTLFEPVRSGDLAETIARLRA